MSLLKGTSSFRSRGRQFHPRLRSSFDQRICAGKVRSRIGREQTRLRRQINIPPYRLRDAAIKTGHSRTFVILTMHWSNCDQEGSSPGARPTHHAQTGWASRVSHASGWRGVQFLLVGLTCVRACGPSKKQRENQLVKQSTSNYKGFQRVKEPLFITHLAIRWSIDQCKICYYCYKISKSLWRPVWAQNFELIYQRRDILLQEMRCSTEMMLVCSIWGENISGWFIFKSTLYFSFQTTVMCLLLSY